jgi:hypothetical protein
VPNPARISLLIKRPHHFRFFVSIVATFHKKKAPPMYQPERRKCARHAVNLGTVLAPVDGIGQVCSGTIRNISCGGICLSAHSGIEPETTIFVLLKTVVKARVVRVALESAGRWRLNCAFVKEMGCSEMEGLLPGYSWLSDPLPALIDSNLAN